MSRIFVKIKYWNVWEGGCSPKALLQIPPVSNPINICFGYKWIISSTFIKLSINFSLMIEIGRGWEHKRRIIQILIRRNCLPDHVTNLSGSATSCSVDINLWWGTDITLKLLAMIIKFSFKNGTSVCQLMVSLGIHFII